LIDRMRTGRGRRLDISVMETMLLQHQSTFARTAAGDLRRRTGRYTEVYPLTVRPCRDGYVSIGVVTDAEFDKFAIAIDRPELSVDPRFADKDTRWEHRDALDREMAVWLEVHDADDIVATLQSRGVACAAVAGPLDITRNPQLLSREYWRQAGCGGAMPGNPLAHLHPFAQVRTPLPELGEPGELPLAGVRVLDFTIFWAGPSTTRSLADLGAEVVWVERPGARLDCNIDPGTSPSPVETMMHLYDTKMFRGKRSIALDLEKPEDRAVAHALAREAHIVVENFRPGVADRLGVGPGELSRINPALTYVSLSGWGGSGPWRDWRSYGPSIEAASSIEGRTGYAGGEPLRLGHAFPDATGGLIGGLASLRGLRRSTTGGGGGWYDISQLETYLAMSGEGIIEATGRARGIERVGNRSRLGAVQGVFPCGGQDQWIAIRLETEEDCQRFSSFSGLTVSLTSDRDEIEPDIAAFTREHDKQALARQLQAEGLQAFAVLDAHELTSDPHLRERGYFLQVEAGVQAYPMPGTPLVASPRMADATAPAPRPGEHSEQVCSEIAAIADSP
jgi:crotonobetainyl-CoA:carnitine CoA-transferase CaiB-like acyl-CoA transferase